MVFEWENVTLEEMRGVLRAFEGRFRGVLGAFVGRTGELLSA